MNTDTKAAAYHSEAYNKAGASIMSFNPINQVHQHLCGLHSYAGDPSRQVKSHHFCSHISPDFHQCIIYDSDAPNARLIGIEYIVTKEIFDDLPAEEKRYWHSHKYEVESGQLHLVGRSLVPEAALLESEQPAMLNLRTTYGKTIHTWQYDKHPSVPLGPPQLMMSVTSDDQLSGEAKQAGQSRREHRATYLPTHDDFEPSKEADVVINKGVKLNFEPTEEPL